jgi:hypothetical protein
VFGLLALVVVLVLGFLVYQYGGELPSLPAVEVEEGTDCYALSEVHEKDICYLKLARNKGAACDNLYNRAFQRACQEKIWETDTCLYQQFIEQVSEDCQKKIEQQDCRHAEDYVSCLTTLAIQENDVGLCDTLLDCVVSFAIATEDGSVCETTPGSGTCGAAYYKATGDATYCTFGDLWCGYDPTWSDTEKKTFFEKHNASLPNREEYILSFGADKQEPLICDYYQNDNIISLLQQNQLTSPDFCVMAIASRLQDQELCNLFTETYKNSFCLELLTCQQTTTNEALCHAIP